MTERRRVVPHHGPWREQHRIVAACTATSGPCTGRVDVAFQVGVHVGAEGRARGAQASFQATVEFADVENASSGPPVAGRPIVLVADEIPVPDSGWELRTSGLWADHNCETPFEHWSYGLEAFALAVDDRTELLGRAYGDRTPLGWELDFEAADPIADIDESATGLAGYSQTGRLHGIVQLTEGDIEVTGTATRWRWWGSGHPGGKPVLGTRTPAATALPTPEGVWWVEPAGASDEPDLHDPDDVGDDDAEMRCER